MSYKFGDGARMAKLLLARTPKTQPMCVFLTTFDAVERKILEACGYQLRDDDSLIEAPQLRKFSKPEFMDSIGDAAARRVQQAMGTEPLPLPWRAAMHPVATSTLTPLEHLWMCMVAHIGYDLAVSVAEAPMNDPRDHHTDWSLLSGILKDMIDDMQQRIRTFWPPARWLDALAGQVDEELTARLISWSRENAWDDAMRIRDTAPMHRSRAQRELALRCVFVQTQLVTASFVPLKLAGFLH